MPDGKDELYAEPRHPVEGFQFNADVSRVFTDMIERSVPGYSLLLEMLPLLAARFAVAGTRCYDLGSSLGQTALSICDGLPGTDFEVIAVDSSPDMVARCKENFSKHGSKIPTSVLCQDIREINIENASIVALNFTLQFIPPEDRLPLTRRIYGGLNDGGVVVLSEKIAAPDQSSEDLVADLLEELHQEFKLAKGYSQLEVAQKRQALEDVLIPEPTSAHVDRLRSAGFREPRVWFQCLNFQSILAIK